MMIFINFNFYKLVVFFFKDSSTSCDNLECLNGGVCSKNVYTKERYFCHCKPEYSGPDCSLKIS